MRKTRWRSSYLWAVFFAFACSIGAACLAQGSDPSTWPIVYQDDFEDLQSGWAVEETEDSATKYVDGNYEIQVKNARSIAWSQIPGNREFLDFSLETDIQVVEGTGEFGVIFRYVDSDNFYKFTINTDGHYQLVLREQGTYYTLLDGQVGTKGETKTKAKREGIYRLKVVAESASLSFFLDGNLLAASSDSSFGSGQIALCAETSSGPRLIVRFAHLELRAPLEQQPIGDRAGLLYSQGSALYKSNSYEPALAPLSEACQLFESLGWTEEFAQSAYLLADSLYNLARYKEVLLQFQRAANAFLATNSSQMAALSLSSHGNCLIELGEYEESLHSFQQAHTLYQDVEDKWGMATTLIYSSMSYAGLGDYRAAIEAGEGAIDLYKTLDEQMEVSLTSNTLAIYCILLGDYTMAQRYSIEALTLCNDLDDPPGMALACTILGHTHLATGDLDLATEDFKQALSISSAATDFPLDLRAMILEGLATCLLEQEEPELARQCLELAQSMRETLGDPRGKAASLSSLGDYWYALGDYQKAIQYYEASLAISVYRSAYNPAGHLSHKLLFGRHKTEIRPSERKRNTDALAFARSDIETHLTRAFEHP